MWLATSKIIRFIMKKDPLFKKERKPSKIHRKKKSDYDEYGDKRNEKIDYEKDKPPHW